MFYVRKVLTTTSDIEKLHAVTVKENQLVGKVTVDQSVTIIYCGIGGDRFLSFYVTADTLPPLQRTF